MSISELLALLESDPKALSFTQVIDCIDQHYQFSAVGFRVGEQINAAGSNLGSCKIFAFAQLQQLSEQHTLSLFGDYYFIDVLQHPEADDHANIRNFMQFGRSAVSFDATALVAAA